MSTTGTTAPQSAALFAESEGYFPGGVN
ncbi:MAG: hypothetical protein QN178_03660, partial [Armatimonadota bacterium]|nr:hypothetical protein [Armatimonadota bacterium]